MLDEVKKTPTTSPIEDAPPLVGLPTGRIVMYVSIVWLLYFLDFMARFGINPIYPLIQKDLGLSDPQVGLLGSVVLFGMAILVLPLSYFADRWSRAKLLSLMAMVWSFCSVLSGMAQNFGVMLLARTGLGVGEASFAPTATSLLTDWFRRSQWGRVLGFFNTAVSLGIFCGSLFAGYMATTYGWRAALIAIGAPGVVLGLLALAIPDRVAPAGKAAEKPSVAEAIAMVRANRSLLMLVIFYGVFNMGIIAMLSWIPMFYTRVLGLTVQQAAGLAGAGALLGVVGFPLGGYVADVLAKRDPRYRVWLPAAMSLIVALVFAAAFAAQSVPLILLASFFSNFVNPALNASTQELSPSRLRSVSLGIVIFGMQFIGMIGPYATGVLSQEVGLQSAMIWMQASFVVCCVGFLLIGLTYRNDLLRAAKAS
jgi:MFS transporter, Spinster family, sphingosine-1-phosphate transporter